MSTRASDADRAEAVDHLDLEKAVDELVPLIIEKVTSGEELTSAHLLGKPRAC